MITQHYSKPVDPQKVTTPLADPCGYLHKALAMRRALPSSLSQVTCGSQQGSRTQEEGDSLPSRVPHCCCLTLSSKGKLWAGDHSSSPHLCLTHRGTLGSPLSSPQDK